jgi:hypothetical protein
MKNVRLEELLGYVREGRILDAMREFYAEEVVMEEPLYGTTTGLEANLAREEQFVSAVKEIRNFAVSRMAVGEDTAFYENVMDWLGVDGNEYHIEQVSVQTWKDGKIVHERFYYSLPA